MLKFKKGSKINNMKEKEKGQALLLLVLLSATILAIAGAVFFESRVQTKITKIQEESARALEAAEGLAEQALQTGGTVTLESQALTSLKGFSGTATIETTQSNIFTTPQLLKDEQYVIYLFDYENYEQTGSFGSGTSSLTMSIGIDDSSGDVCSTDPTFTVELTFINAQTGDLERHFSGCQTSPVKNDLSFHNLGASFSIAGPYHFIIARVIAGDNFPGAKLKFTRNDGQNWPLQGRTATSTVKASSGVTKTIRIFQSYPQIPSSFFITQF